MFYTSTHVVPYLHQENSDVVSSQINIYMDDTTIYHCLNSKPDRSDKGEQVSVVEILSSQLLTGAGIDLQMLMLQNKTAV